MKILYVVTGLSLGGAEKVVCDLADQMVSRGHEVKIAYLKGKASVWPKNSDVELIDLGLESPKNLFFASKKYRQLIRQYQPDIVHAHMVHANIFARINRIGCKISRLICTAHNSNEGGWLRMQAYRWTNYLSDTNTNVSKEAVSCFIEKGAFTQEHSMALYNGISLDKFQKILDRFPSVKKDIQFITVGRLNDQKDYPNLLNAIAVVIQKYPHCHFSIVGEGPLKSTIETLIHSLNLEQHVTLLGRREDIPELMNQSDCFILPSKYEGFGLVVAEAMACETFVIATDCGGVKEVMGGQGILVEPQNSTVLSQAIMSFMELSDDEININNKQALQYVKEHFNLHQIADQWERLYES